jgi:hypothetical protein
MMLGACSRDEKAAAARPSPAEVPSSVLSALPPTQPSVETVAFLRWVPSALESPLKTTDRHECYIGVDPNAGWCKGEHIVGDLALGTQNTYSVDWLKGDPGAVRLSFAPLRVDREIECSWLGYSELRRWSYANATKQLCSQGQARTLIEQYAGTTNSTKVIVFTMRYAEKNEAFERELSGGP